MAKSIRKNFSNKIKACGGKRGKGCGSSWAGATTVKTKIKVAA
jgi:hypothetical protein